MKQCLRRSWTTADIFDQGLQAIPYAEEPLKFSVIFMLIKASTSGRERSAVSYIFSNALKKT